MVGHRALCGAVRWLPGLSQLCSSHSLCCPGDVMYDCCSGRFLTWLDKNDLLGKSSNKNTSSD